MSEGRDVAESGEWVAVFVCATPSAPLAMQRRIALSGQEIG